MLLKPTVLWSPILNLEADDFCLFVSEIKEQIEIPKFSSNSFLKITDANIGKRFVLNIFYNVALIMY